MSGHLLQPQTGDIPRPYPSAWSEPYWAGAKRGELLFQRCGDCGGAVHTPAMLCSHCHSQNLSWEASAGTGTVYSFTTVWRPQTPEFTVPYVAVVVEMDEGWHMLSNLVGCDAEDAAVGMRVQITFHALDDEVTLPYFQPVE